MANVQVENGFTRIANELLDVVIRMPFNATHLKIVLVCWRYLYGFQRKQAELSESFISKATSISKRYISKEMRTLIDAKVINVVRESSYTSPRIIAFNKNYEQWEYRTTVPQVNLSSTGEPQNNTTVEQQFNTTVEQQFHQEKKTIKKENKYSADFEIFYSEYPRPEDKRRTYNNWRTQLKNYSVEQLMAACRKYKVIKAGTERQYLKSSANFLGREKPFEDYLTENCKQDENINSEQSYPYGQVVRAPDGWRG